MRSERTGDTVTAYLEGELDHSVAARTRTALDALLISASVRALVLDLSGLRFMDSSGVGVVLGRYNLLKRRGGRLRIRGAQPAVRKVLRLCGIEQLLESEARGEARGL